MNSTKRNEYRQLAETVERRVGLGQSDMVSGWHQLLRGLFQQMKSYLIAGRIITFQDLTAHEVAFFESLSSAITVPDQVVGFYLPPSVRRQMMGEGPLDDDEERDLGSVVVSHVDVKNIIVNALFALPPFTPAVDVYESGQMVAGYQFSSMNECRDELQQIIARHLN
jgi:hypothetical protein